MIQTRFTADGRCVYTPGKDELTEPPPDIGQPWPRSFSQARRFRRRWEDGNGW